MTFVGAPLRAGIGCWIAVASARPVVVEQKQSDPLLGKWICLADNVHKKPDATLEFRSDGIALFQVSKIRPRRWKYKREPVAQWAARRKNGAQVDFNAWLSPNAEAVYFADEKGRFIDSGGWLLFLNPKDKVLGNPLTQLWCRPGDEARVKRLIASWDWPPFRGRATVHK